jgi:uncharacterized membrane protein
MIACVQLFINDICPSATELATLNALSLTISSGIRAVTPAAFTSLFAFGVKIGWLDGHMTWLILAGLTIPLSLALLFVPQAVKVRPNVSQ